MSGMDCRGVVDAVAHEADDMSVPAQGVDDAPLLLGVDAREKAGAFGLRGEPAIGEAGDVASRQHAVCRQADGPGDVLDDARLITRNDLQVDAEPGEFRHRRGSIRLYRVGKDAEAG
jgi:hypothetical protein